MTASPVSTNQVIEGSLQEVIDSFMLWYLLPQFLVAGITNGSIYALIALGYCLIQNATGLVNFAQGDFVMLGAMIMISITQLFHVPVIPAFLLSMIVVALVGILLEQLQQRLDLVLRLSMVTIQGGLFQKYLRRRHILLGFLCGLSLAPTNTEILL